MRRKEIAAIAALFLVCAGAASTRLLHHVDDARQQATLNEVIYVSSPKLLKRLSLGYNGLLADVYWTRVVQYYGGKHHTGGGRYELLWPLLHITSELDPKLIPVYEFGGTFLAAEPPNGAGDPQHAIELVEYGIRNNPNDWHLYYDLGYLYYDRQDYTGAAKAFEQGSHVPNAHPFLKVLAAQMAQHGGDVQTAGMLWTAIYETTRDKYIRENAEWHLRAVKADLDCEALEKLVQAYRQRTGTLPASFAELTRVGIMRGVPVDPMGNEYQMDDQGHVFVADPENFPFIQKALPPGYVPKTVQTIPYSKE
jgi:tetratricopeptide (TPR) repeat protein